MLLLCFQTSFVKIYNYYFTLSSVSARKVLLRLLMKMLKSPELKKTHTQKTHTTLHIFRKSKL